MWGGGGGGGGGGLSRLHLDSYVHHTSCVRPSRYTKNIFRMENIYSSFKLVTYLPRCVRVSLIAKRDL